MHGRKKSTEPRSEAEIKTLDRKTELYSKTLYIVLERKKCKDFTEEALELTAKMLKSNPDFYSVWNYRKEILVAMIPDLAIVVNTDHNRIVNDEVRVRELKLSEDCIRKNPKSYGAWHHRQWILERIQVDFYSELELCKLFLMEDQRNFHCWCYRRLVVNIGDIKPTDEFAFSAEKIDENFSNYSAFHHRSVYIQKLGQNALDMVEAEFSIIENAIYTEPDDQSAWWYHQFLLTWISQQQQQQQQQGVQQSNNSDDITSSSSSSGIFDEPKWMKLLNSQITVMESLLEVEVTSKWAMTSLSMMLELLLKVLCSKDQLEGDSDTIFSQSIQELDEKRQTLLSKLCQVDPYHVNRYKYLQRRKYCRNLIDDPVQ